MVGKKRAYRFRINLGIGKDSPDGEPLNCILNAKNAGQKEVWAGDNSQTLVLPGKWHLLETFKEHDNDHGRFYASITARTRRAPNGITDVVL